MSVVRGARRSRARGLGGGALVVTLVLGGLGLGAPAASAVDTASPVVISEVYGGGGNANALFRNDFIELYNNSASAVNLSGWSVQYASATGTSWTNSTNLKGLIPAHGHYLIAEASQAAVGDPLPSPAVSGSIAMAAGAGKVALVKVTTPLTCGSTCSTNSDVVDFVGYGPTASDAAGGHPTGGLSSTTSASRKLDPFANTGDNAADFTVDAPSPTNSPGAGDEPDPEPGGNKTIAEIQGTGASSPVANQTVTTKGVVTAVYPTGGYNGYTIQTPGTGGPRDLDAASDGLFVFSASAVSMVHIGDYVEVTGKVTEFNGLTELTVTGAADLTVLTEEHASVTAATTSSWPATGDQRESLESMLYRPSGDYVVADAYGTNQYGEVVLAAGTKPLIQPTEVALPDSPGAAAVAADNAARAVTLDDGASTNFLASANSGLTPPYISLTDPVRTTEKVTFTKDVIVDYRNNTWKFQPTAPYPDKDTSGYPVTFENNRAATPNAATIGNADLRVASFNVQNYFTTFGADVPGCSSYDDRAGNPITVNTCPGNGPRGAWNAENLARQQSKIVEAINASGVDVAGLMEIENSVVLGKSKDAALATLVAALNADAGSQKWDYVRSSSELPAAALMDVISSAIIYQPAKVNLVGESRALGTESATGGAFDNAREPLGQVFVGKTAGAKPFLFVVNHFKSKGSAGPWPGDVDTGNGVGASNESRVRQAKALRDWIPTVLASTETPTTAVVMVGDYNSYGKEDPVNILTEAGYTEVEQHFDLGKYSYVYKTLSGSLDHVFVNADALARTTGADIWNINSVESIALNYSRYNYHGTLFWDGTVPFAASDHDPVVVGLNNTDEPTGPAQCSTEPFWDVPVDSDFCPQINWLTSTGIASGYQDPGHDLPGFHPMAAVSRQAMAAFLYRAANPGQTAPACTEQEFWDVPVDAPFCAEISWLASQGITTGYDDGGQTLPGFHPTAAVSRQAMAAFLYRFGNPGQTAPACTTQEFWDVAVNAPFCAEIGWLAAEEITTGYDDAGHDQPGYHPADAVTRQAMAAFLYRANEAGIIDVE